MSENCEHGCECLVCEHGLDKAQQIEAEAITKYGWYAHYVTGDETDIRANYHTHGLPETHNHPDLQIVFPINPRIAHSLIWNAVRLIEAGTTLKNGDIIKKIAGGGFKVAFIDATECDRPVLRMILPDKNGKLAKEEIEGTFQIQYDLTPT